MKVLLILKMKNKIIKKIAITGGKGGTGKSTFSIMLALDLLKKNNKVVLCDCDVECPNDYLLLGRKLVEPNEKIYINFPKLIKDKCQKCGLCVKTCYNNAVFQNSGNYPSFINDLCSGCGACWLACPNKAIETSKEVSGKMYINEFDNFKNFYLVTGEAKEGLEETGPIVLKTKKYALNFAKKIGADYVLFDTAAGTHCPVISALLDCDMAYAVTEPTPMGAHDLGLILDLIEELKVDYKVVLNQADMGDRELIENVMSRYNKKIEKEIPYSKKIVEAYSEGRLLENL